MTELSIEDAYPRECPYCEATLDRPSAFDLHMHRAHTDEEADKAVAEAIIDELGLGGDDD